MLFEGIVHKSNSSGRVTPGSVPREPTTVMRIHRYLVINKPNIFVFIIPLRVQLFCERRCVPLIDLYTFQFGGANRSSKMRTSRLCLNRLCPVENLRFFGTSKPHFFLRRFLTFFFASSPPFPDFCFRQRGAAPFNALNEPPCFL